MGLRGDGGFASEPGEAGRCARAYSAVVGSAWPAFMFDTRGPGFTRVAGLGLWASEPMAVTRPRTYGLPMSVSCAVSLSK